MQEASIRIRKALADVPWLTACGEAALEHLAAHARIDQVPDGATVAWRGRQVAHMLVIVRGALELSITNAKGKRHVINRHEAGEVFGLIPVLDDSEAIHDAVALGPSEIVFVPQAALRSAMRACPDLSDQIIRQLCARARRAYETMAARSLAELPVRIARVLLARMQGPVIPTVDMTQSDLADMLGITRQSLNLELKRLEREGMLRIGRGRIEISDEVRLGRFAASSD